MNFPPLKNVDFAPFLNVVNQVKGHLTQAIGSITDPEVRDMFSGLLGEMESKQAQLEVEAPQWKANAEARYAGIINKFKEADTKKEALLSQLKELKAEIGVKIQLAKAKAAEATEPRRLATPDRETEKNGAAETHPRRHPPRLAPSRRGPQGALHPAHPWQHLGQLEIGAASPSPLGWE